jgi:predicted transcriptional regulator
MLQLALSRASITASAAAKALDLKITNASMKLKQLEQQGYLLRKEVVSPSGGKEFVYLRIK